MRNPELGASLEVRKLYPVIADAEAETDDLIRIIDESGEDYLYPANLFQRLTLPSEVQRALSAFVAQSIDELDIDLASLKFARRVRNAGERRGRRAALGELALWLDEQRGPR